MSLARTALRAAIVTTLAGVVPGIGNKVFMNRVTPLARDELPALLIYMLDGSDEISGAGPLEAKRTCDVVLKIAVTESEQVSDMSDELDRLSALVEIEIFKDDSFGNRFEQFAPANWTIELPDENNDTVGSLTTTYAAIYRESFPATTTGAVDFAGVDSDIDSDPDNGQIESSRNLDLETS